MSTTPQHAIGAAKEIFPESVTGLSDDTAHLMKVAAIIAAHPDPELARLREKIENQRQRIVYLEGATNHATGTPLSLIKAERDQLRAEVAEWKSAHASELSKRIASDYLLDQANTKIKELETENARLRDALTKLRDCDWVISLPDRMDAVRNIARDALAASKETKP